VEDEPADPAEKTVGRGKKRMAAGASKVSSASVTTGASTKTTSAVTAVAAAITVAEQQEQQEEPMAQKTHAEALLAQDSRAPQSSTGIDATTSSGEAPVIATTDPRIATSTDSDGEFVREAAGSNANTPPASTADMDAPAISSNVLAVAQKLEVPVEQQPKMSVIGVGETGAGASRSDDANVQRGAVVSDDDLRVVQERLRRMQASDTEVGTQGTFTDDEEDALDDTIADFLHLEQRRGENLLMAEEACQLALLRSKVSTLLRISTTFGVDRKFARQVKRKILLVC
jgi:hypothetical protein